MGVVVDLDQRASTFTDYAFGYLLTSSVGAVKAVTDTTSVRRTASATDHCFRPL